MFESAIALFNEVIVVQRTQSMSVIESAANIAHCLQHLPRSVDIPSEPVRKLQTCHADRFNAERRKDRAQISGLVQDATAVETALRNGARRRQRGENDSCQGGGGSSAGTVGSSTSTKSNAYVEPSEPKEDPSFISLDQARRRLDMVASDG